MEIKELTIKHLLPFCDFLKDTSWARIITLKLTKCVDKIVDVFHDIFSGSVKLFVPFWKTHLLGGRLALVHEV